MKLRTSTLDASARSDVRRMVRLLAPFVRPLSLAALLLLLSNLLTPTLS